MLTDITKHVNGVTEVIAASARQKAASIEAVESAVSEVDKVMQQTAASAEESSSAATELNAHAEELGATVSTFRLHADGTLERPVRNRPRPSLSGPQS